MCLIHNMGKSPLMASQREPTRDPDQPEIFGAHIINTERNPAFIR